MRSLDKEVFVCLDCETTGLDLQADRIIEVAVAKFTWEGIHEQFESLVDPDRAIPDASRAIHHISDEMVKGQPKIHELLPDILGFIGNATIVGHGIYFDMQMLHNSAKRHEIDSSLIYNTFIDTLRLARLYGESPINSLEKLRQHFNIEQEGAHRAMSDVLVNISVFKQLSRQYRTKDQLLQALSKPIHMKIMPLGKYKGRLLKDVPLEYLHWAVHKDFDQDLIFSLKQEIGRRKKGNSFSQAANPFMQLFDNQ